MAIEINGIITMTVGELQDELAKHDRSERVAMRGTDGGQSAIVTVIRDNSSGRVVIDCETNGEFERMKDRLERIKEIIEEEE